MSPFWIIRIINLGIKNLLLHKLRSFLNMLGILFGVGSVIAMLAIGEGAKWKAQQMIKRLGPTTILVYSRKPAEEENTTGTNSRIAEFGVLYKDLDRILETIPSVKIIVPVRKAKKEIWSQGRRVDAMMLGTIPRYTEVTHTKLISGRWLSRLDFDRCKPVCVITKKLACWLFPAENPLGRTIRVASTAFSVVGVIVRDGGGGGKGISSAQEPLGMYTPMTALLERFGEINIQRSTGSMSAEKVEVHEAQIKVAEVKDVLAVAKNVRTMMAKNHKKEDYQIRVPLEELRIAEENARIWTIVLSCVAGISLLVGGIGIMNVMLATVTERTREIGIRRALGATRSHIMSQFLVETLVLTLIGGILGVFFGWLLPVIVNSFTHVKADIPLYAVLLAPGISLIVGLLSGLYPAWKAADMDPVEALRHE